jgi:hypothetical protein
MIHKSRYKSFEKIDQPPEIKSWLYRWRTSRRSAAITRTRIRSRPGVHADEPVAPNNSGRARRKRDET